MSNDQEKKLAAATKIDKKLIEVIDRARSTYFDDKFGSSKYVENITHKVHQKLDHHIDGLILQAVGLESDYGRGMRFNNTNGNKGAIWNTVVSLCEKALGTWATKNEAKIAQVTEKVLEAALKSLLAPAYDGMNYQISRHMETVFHQMIIARANQLISERMSTLEGAAEEVSKNKEAMDQLLAELSKVRY